MPLVAFTSENTRSTGDDFPKLKFDKGETARIAMIQSSPHFEFVHTLNAPKLLNGMPSMVTKERLNGEQYVTHDMDYVGRFVCLGDATVVAAEGLDTSGVCPACAASAAHPDWVYLPQRRFAMPVLVYGTQAGGFNLRTPFTAEVKVWAFTEKRFDKIVGIAGQWDLTKHDLLLGPCTNKSYQNYEIVAGPGSAYQESVEAQQLTQEIWTNNQPTDLSDACARTLSSSLIQRDVDKVLGAWNQVQRSEAAQGQAIANRAPGAAGPVGFGEQLTQSMVAPVVQQPTQMVPAAVVPIATPMPGQPVAAPVPMPVAAAPAAVAPVAMPAVAPVAMPAVAPVAVAPVAAPVPAAAVPTAAAEVAGTLNFGDLLGGVE